MFNLIKDEFDENTEDILTSINKMLEKNNKEKKKEKQEEKKEDKKEDKKEETDQIDIIISI